MQAFLTVAILVYMGAHIYFDKKLGVPTCHTSARARRAILDFIPSEAPSTAAPLHIVEMGSGWGGVAMAIARARPHSRVVGIEYSIFPFLISIFRKKLNPALKNLEFVRADFFNYSLKNASIVVCYLLVPMLERLRGKFLAELPADACIISNNYLMPGWTAEKTIEVNGLIDDKRVSLYTMAKVRQTQ